MRITHRYDAFQGTTKEATALKFGVIGINVHARKPSSVEPIVEAPSESWVARLRRAVSRIGGRKLDASIGATAPDFDLPVHGASARFRLSARGNAPTLLMFLPPDWCPVCQMCLRKYREHAPLLRARGVRVGIVTSEVTEQVSSFVEALEVGATIAVDGDCEVARSYGATHRSSKTGEHRMLPVSFFIDEAGRVGRRTELDTNALCIDDLEELLSRGA